MRRRTKRSRMGVVLLSAALLGACGAPEEATPQPPGQQKGPAVVEVAAAARSTVARRLTLTGTVEPRREARLASPAEGPVESVSVREGDRVAAGDTVVTIGRTQGAEALTVSLEEELRKERDNLRRTRELVADDALPGEAVDEAAAAYEGVRAQLVLARESAADSTIVAPWGGVVSVVHVREGAYVAPRTTLVEVYDPASLVIRAAVPERHAAEVHPGMEVALSLDAHPDRPLTGRVDRAYPYLDPRLRTRTVEILPHEPVSLLPGMFARLELQLESVDDAVVVPVEAVLATPRGDEVVVVADGTAVRRPVVTGIEDGRRIQIVDGLEAGEEVAVAGHEKLRNGAAVRPAQPGGPSAAKPGPGNRAP